MLIPHEKEEQILAPLHRSLIKEKVTAAQMRKLIEESLLLLKPDAIEHHSEILMAIDNAGFSIECTSMIVTRAMAETLVASFATPDMNNDRAAAWREQNIEHLISGTVLAVVVRRVQAVSALLSLLGPNSPAEAKRVAPESVRARFGTDDIRNAVYSSPTKEQAYRDVVLVLGYTPQAAVQEDASKGDSEWDMTEADQTHLSVREMKELTKRQLEELKQARAQLALKEAELKRREDMDIEEILYPNGRPMLKLAVGSTDIIDSASSIIRHCASTSPMGLPLTPRGMRALYDSLDPEKRGVITRTTFREFYEGYAPLENYGVPDEAATLDRKLAPFKETGISFDNFCVFLYQAARR